ncbi:receptor-like protein 7 [Juglans microcarpa x Juglans regia]|uniref:receptor-like protein 7 n=1 Tax=Juglans microcarpa x Juglans regia TaxID=2249226 RepID=UPI001B7F6105|nr:receptor-like protein 7 [Juglans microcarpa x Juglans regia]
MPTCFRFLFSDLLVLFLLLLMTSLSSPQPLCHQDESLALMQFMDSFIIYNDTSCPTSWRVEAEHGRSDCCSWVGVECDPHTAHVIGLDLSFNCLYGSINSNSSLFRLSHLRSLNLAYIDFNSSKIPSTIGNLSRLTYLNLSQSNVSVEVPSEVSYLSKLSSLDLSYNNDLFYIGSLTRLVQNLTCLEEILLTQVNISSIVPESLANLSSLRTLELEGCGLYGEFPIRIFQLPQLRDLWIGNNEDLTGQLPEFHSCTVLQALLLSYTSFSGSIPNSLWNLTQLTLLDLSGNSFDNLSCLTKASSNHTFPRLQYLGLSSLNLTKFPNFLRNQNKLLHLENLQDLYISYNFLTGFENSRDVLPWPNLQKLDLQNSKLQGLFLISLLAPSIQVLYLSNNFLTGLENSQDVLPWPNLRILDLRNNRLQGSFLISQIPPSIQKLYLSNNFLTGFENSRDVLPWPNLRELYLENNSLQGYLPIPPPYVQYYQVNKNAFTGEIPPLFCNLSSLYMLDFSYNNLSGELHPCFCNLSQSILALELRSNNIGGTIPDAWANGCNLRILDLSHNQLQGRLPRSLANCKELEYLDVGYNKIHDTFPLWLGTLSKLKIFILRSNGFYSAIRNIQINCTLSNLHIIDLSHNNFSGDLPAECFQRWNTMKLFGAKEFKYLDYYSGFSYSITLTTKGIELKYEKIQDELIVIDLSCNKFEGEIPEVVGNLKGLHILNFSNNALSGHIPSSLANLKELESLDLSQNKLFGEIPPQLVQLTFLAIFKVFNNCLIGPIPHGNQFEIFPNSSFDGNPALCERSLSKACGDSLPKPPNEGNQGLVSPFEFGWKVVAIGYGCGFVIEIVIGQWIIARKQDWFVNTFRIKK